MTAVLVCECPSPPLLLNPVLATAPSSVNPSSTDEFLCFRLLTLFLYVRVVPLWCLSLSPFSPLSCRDGV